MTKNYINPCCVMLSAIQALNAVTRLCTDPSPLRKNRRVWVVAYALIGQLSFLLVPNILLSKMNNHEHQTKQTYESYTFQPLMSFSVAYYVRYLF